MGPEFPGIREFLSLIEEKVLDDASRKFDGKNRSIASALKISESVISAKMKLLKVRKSKVKRLPPCAQVSDDSKDMEMLQ